MPKRGLSNGPPTNLGAVELSQSNPYAAGQLITDSEGVVVLERTPYTPQRSAGDVYHTLRQGETLSGIARRYYAALVPEPERYWHVIADANGIGNGLNVGVEPAWGTVLMVPELEQYLILNEV